MGAKCTIIMCKFIKSIQVSQLKITVYSAKGAEKGWKRTKRFFFSMSSLCEQQWRGTAKIVLKSSTQSNGSQTKKRERVCVLEKKKRKQSSSTAGSTEVCEGERGTLMQYS